MRHLYLIKPKTESESYDYYDSAIVCANSVEDARKIHPDTDGGRYTDTLNIAKWNEESIRHYWCASPSEVTVRLLGVAGRVARGVVLASHNAG